MGPARSDDVGHCPDGLLDRRVRVGTVAIDEVEVVEAEPFERAVDRLHEVLAVQREVGVDGPSPWMPQKNFEEMT